MRENHVTIRRLGARRLTGGAIAVAVVGLLGVALSAGQDAPTQAPPMAEEVYLNVQVLKGIPVDTFNDTTGMFASALLLDCVGCHINEINFDTKAFAVSETRPSTATSRISRARCSSASASRSSSLGASWFRWVPVVAGAQQRPPSLRSPENPRMAQVVRPSCEVCSAADGSPR